MSVLFAILWLAMGAIVAEAQQPPLNHTESKSAGGGSAPQLQAPQPSGPAVPQIDRDEITKRANQEVGSDIHATIAEWKGELDRLELELHRATVRYVELNNFRGDLQQVRSSVESFWGALKPRLDSAKAEMDLLGSPPATGQPQEPEDLALRRAELNYHFGLLTEGQSAVNAAHLRIDQLVNTIQDVRRKNFTTRLFQRVPGAYSYQTWADTPKNAPLVVGRIADLLGNWWKHLPEHDHLEILHTAVEAGLLWFVLTLVRWWGVRGLRTWRQGNEPPFWSRTTSAAGTVLLRSLPVAVPLIFLYATIIETKVLPETIDWLFYSAVQSIIVIVAVNALVTTALAPLDRVWRLIAASDRAAAVLCGLVVTLAVVYGATSFMYIAARQVQAPFSLTLAIAFSSSLLTSAIVVAILLIPLEGKPRDGRSAFSWPKAVRIPIWAAVAAIVVTALSGYLALSHFLARQLVVTGSILALASLLLLWVEGFAQGLGDDGTTTGRWLKERAGLDQRRREQFSVPIGLILKSVVLTLSVPLIMAQWGYAWPDIYDWGRELFFGFHIPNTEVSVAALLASILVFGVAYAAARLFQGWLDVRILEPAGISGGVRDSIRIAVGYVGIGIAALAAFAYAGFSLSNLAIVAGALSVGIGFGLQSVVNNFVSGLILLAERPIKIGDLVVVAGEEGYVRKISIRSTEVETFDRAHVVVPNSYFITEKVKNWTHRNCTRRMAISVTLDSSSDPRKASTVLLKVAHENPNVLSIPAPSVILEDFGEKFSFKLYVFYDTNEEIQTDLRLAILDALHEAGLRKKSYLSNDAGQPNDQRSSNGRDDGGPYTDALERFLALPQREEPTSRANGCEPSLRQPQKRFNKSDGFVTLVNDRRE
ncbi:MAG: mechanosensitive ion channel domain-containing protein [Hyphomonadaceae bacterium]